MRRWHAVTFSLHVLVAFLIYRIFSARLSATLSLLLAALFVVMASNIALLLDPFVGGPYVLGCAFFLLALKTAWARLDRGDVTRLSDWIPCAVVMTIAGFFFEVFVIMSVWVGERRAHRGRRCAHASRRQC